MQFFLGLANIHSCALLRLKKFVSFSKVHLATSFFNGKVGIFFLGRKKKCLSLVCCAYTVIDFRVCRLDGAKGSNKISFEVLGGKRRLLNPHGGLQAQSSVQSCTQKTKSNPFNHHNFWGPQNGAGLSTRDKNWGCFYLLSKATIFFLFPYPIFSLCLKNLSWEKSSLGGGPWKLPFFSIVFALLLQTTCKTLFFLISQCKANSWGKNTQFFDLYIQLQK